MTESREPDTGSTSDRRGGVISVVVPICNEEQNIPELYERLKAALAMPDAHMDHELVFVNDGSRDASLELLLQLADSDTRVRVVDLARNFGHQLAITAGIDTCTGDVVVLIDGDLQDPPEVIPTMIERWQAGADVVYGVRNQRRGESRFKRASAQLFYRVVNRLSDTALPLDAGDFRLLDRSVVDVLGDMREENRYLRGMITWVGFRQEPLLYDRDQRHAGQTKYTLGRMIHLASNGIVSFSGKPLVLSAQIGAVVTAVAFIYAVIVLVGRIVHPGSVIEGWTSVLVAILFLGGIQLLSIGILGVYLGRVFNETKGRPLYVVARRVGFGECRVGIDELSRAGREEI